MPLLRLVRWLVCRAIGHQDQDGKPASGGGWTVHGVIVHTCRRCGAIRYSQSGI